MNDTVRGHCKNFSFAHTLPNGAAFDGHKKGVLVTVVYSLFTRRVVADLAVGTVEMYKGSVCTLRLHMGGFICTLLSKYRASPVECISMIIGRNHHVFSQVLHR